MELRGPETTSEYYAKVMNVSGMAECLRIAPTTIYRLAKAGKTPCGKVGRAWRIRKDAIDNWISEQPDSSNDSTLPINELD